MSAISKLTSVHNLFGKLEINGVELLEFTEVLLWHYARPLRCVLVILASPPLVRL
jgi:hypothetical protein